MRKIARRGRHAAPAAACIVIVFGFATTGGNAVAGIADGIHKSTIKYCFVGNAMTAKPDDVKYIQDNLKIFENFGHIKYELMSNGGVCPAPTQTADKQFDVHDGDLRIGVPGTLDLDGTTAITGLALGKGCADPGTTGWWGNFPSNLDVPKFRACRLNAFLRKEMVLNKIMHEIGHTLGMIHEHERTDIATLTADPMINTCFKDVSYFGKAISNGPDATFVTPYDRDSVMHYEINNKIDPTNVPASSTCNLGNDNGTTGLSTFDKLSIRIMYPHDEKVAEYVGTTVITAGQKLQLKNEWGDLGALTANVLKSPQWVLKKGNATVTTQKSANFDFAITAAGDYTLTYTFKDMKDRSYANTIPVKVLGPAIHNRNTGALAGARAGLL